MEASALVTSIETPKRLIVKDPFLGKNRLRKEFVSVDEDATPTLDLDSKVWSRLPEDVLLHIFARLPVKDILHMRSLNKTWQSSITSPHFQAAFEEASLVRIALMVHDKADGTMFLTQDDGHECFRPGIARCSEVVLNTVVAATVNGLVCVMEYERNWETFPQQLDVRVFVMNVVTSFRRALPNPQRMASLPSCVRMDAVPELVGGYTITFIHYMVGFLSREVYNSVENRWQKIEDRTLVHLSDKEVFTMQCTSSPSFYENVAAFFTKADIVNMFDLYASHGDFGDGEYIAHSVHAVSGELYQLCARGGQHGVWKKLLRVEETWELVCECPKLEKTWTCLRVFNDVVILLFKLPYYCTLDAQLFGVVGIDVGTIVKVFHMPTKSWHSFPEKDYVVQNWGVSTRKDYARPFVAEVKFDVVP